MPVTVSEIVESQQLPNSAAALCTAAAKTTIQVSKVVVSNPTGSPATYTLYVVPSGGSTGNSTTITPPQSVAAGAAYNDPNVPGLVLNAGDALWGVASAATTLTIAASGVIFS